MKKLIVKRMLNWRWWVVLPIVAFILAPLIIISRTFEALEPSFANAMIKIHRFVDRNEVRR